MALGAIATEARRRLCEFNPQALANTVWAFATNKPVPERRELLQRHLLEIGVMVTE